MRRLLMIINLPRTVKVIFWKSYYIEVSDFYENDNSEEDWPPEEEINYNKNKLI
jgi:hypothetical protein